jgi:zinc transporter 2
MILTHINIGYTFGYHRIQVVGVFFSILLIYGMTGALIYEAVDRLHNPEEVNGPLMFGVALAGVIINLVLGLTLHDAGHHAHHHHHDHNHDHSHDHSSKRNNTSDPEAGAAEPCTHSHDTHHHHHPHHHKDINM